MIKAIYGKIKFNRHECPSCGNSLLNNSPWFKCDVCGYSNCDEKATKFKVIVPPPGIRKTPFMFTTDRECRDFLIRKWQKSIDKDEISLES